MELVRSAASETCVRFKLAVGDGCVWPSPPSRLQARSREPCSLPAAAETMEKTYPKPLVDSSLLPAAAPEKPVPAVDLAIWEKVESTAAAFRQAATAKSLPLGEEVEVIPLSTSLLDDYTATSYLVSRAEQRGVVEYAFKASRNSLRNARHTVAVRGSPGIGKSWSALLYIRMLMNQPKANRRPILFEYGIQPTRRKLLLIAPSTTDAETWEVYALRYKQTLTPDWLDCSIIDIVIDPAQFPSDETPFPSILASSLGHMFIPVSPDNRHLGGLFKAASRMLELVLGPWPLKELLVAFPYMQFTNPQHIYENDWDTYKKTMDTMVNLYYVFGGLPRYLKGDGMSKDRMADMTSEKAETHSEKLLKALVYGERFSDSTNDKILTRYFTLRAGEDDNGHTPVRNYATLDFVSPGAAKAAGKVILRKIRSDVTWRNQRDASDIGLAFERAVLVFLSLGDEGMSKIGVKVRCRKLGKVSVSGSKRDGTDDAQEDASGEPGAPAAEDSSVSLSLEGCSVDSNREPHPDTTSFEQAVKEAGRGMQFDETTRTLKSNKPVNLPPDGYCNYDGMVGADLGLQSTLQKTHSVSGLEYIRQRVAFGLGDSDPFALVFIVPAERFENGWTSIQELHWKKDTSDTSTNRKRRKVGGNATVASQIMETITEADKAKARASISQYVITLDIDD